MTLLELKDLENKYLSIISPLQNRLDTIEKEGMRNRFFQKWYLRNIVIKRNDSNTTIPQVYFDIHGKSILIDENIPEIRKILSKMRDALVKEYAKKNNVDGDLGNIPGFEDYSLAESALSMAEVYLKVRSEKHDLENELNDIIESNKPGMTPEKYRIIKMGRENPYFNHWCYFNVATVELNDSRQLDTPDFELEGKIYSYKVITQEIVDELTQKMELGFFNDIQKRNEILKAVNGFSLALEYKQLERKEIIESLSKQGSHQGMETTLESKKTKNSNYPKGWLIKKVEELAISMKLKQHVSVNSYKIEEIINSIKKEGYDLGINANATIRATLSKLGYSKEYKR